MPIHRLTSIVAALVLVLFVRWAESADVPALSRRIDERITAKLREEKLTPAARATDVELLRRLYVDVLGRIPTADETREFLADESPDRVHRLIDRLIDHEEMPIAWARYVDLWLNGRSPESPPGRDDFLAYLERAIEENRSWQRIASELLQPSLADEVEQGASYFLGSRVAKGDNEQKLDAMTTGVASGLFGVQLQCAKCHDHPLVEQWKQDHYYGLGAFLVRTQARKYRNKTAIGEQAEGEVEFLTTAHEERSAKLMFLDGHVVEEPEPAKEEKDRYVVAKGAKDGRPEVPRFSRRDALVDHAIRRGNPFFERAIVNRVWNQLLGRGLVEPVDQMHAENPATHPELLAYMANYLAAHDFDLKHLIRGILRSEAYQRSTTWKGSGTRPSPSKYGVGLLKPLAPEQLALSLNLATGYSEVLRAKWKREKKKLKVDEVTPVFVRTRIEREREFREIVSQFDNEGAEFQTNASQALYLTYNGTIERYLRPTDGSLVKRVLDDEGTPRAVELVWLTVLARRPTEDEATAAIEYLGDEDPDRETRVRELVWALFSGAEFRFNH